MFNWKVEEMQLMKEVNHYTYNRHTFYSCENKVSRADKIEFVDRMNNGALSYILGLSAKLEQEKESLPKDKFGNIKTVSLKAWINRNTENGDPVYIDNNSVYTGEFNFLGCGRNIASVNRKTHYDIYDDFVDETFHRQLARCEVMECNYFAAHDEYTILKKELREKESQYGTTFGVHLGFSSCDIFVYDDDDINKREIEIDEIRDLLEKYNKVQDLIDSLTKTTSITY